MLVWHDAAISHNMKLRAKTTSNNHENTKEQTSVRDIWSQITLIKLFIKNAFLCSWRSFWAIQSNMSGFVCDAYSAFSYATQIISRKMFSHWMLSEMKYLTMTAILNVFCFVLCLGEWFYSNRYFDFDPPKISQFRRFAFFVLWCSKMLGMTPAHMPNSTNQCV